MRVLGRVNGEGFEGLIQEDRDSRVFFLGDADIDADGANGQHGAQAAYMVGDRGSELLGNGGMGMRGGRVVGVTDWYRDIVICDEKGMPVVFAGGVIASKTSYRFPGRDPRDPAAYVDSETVPYIVVPPIVRTDTKGKVLGCKCCVTHKATGRAVLGVVADIGPRNKVGEVSIEMARRLGLPHSPRIGGTSAPVILYELWPGVPAEGFTLI